jgi:hypothetical protein
MNEFNHPDPTFQPVYDTATGSFETRQARRQDPPHQLSSANSYADFQYLFGAQDPTMLQPKPNRNRRKSSQGGDHVKHRRTRSGKSSSRSIHFLFGSISRGLPPSSLDQKLLSSHRLKSQGFRCVAKLTPCLQAVIRVDLGELRYEHPDE